MQLCSPPCDMMSKHQQLVNLLNQSVTQCKDHILKA